MSGRSKNILNMTLDKQKKKQDDEEAGHTHMECDVDHSMIEKKNSNSAIYHPHDWFQLIRGTGRKNQFEVVEMSQNDFYDFANLLTNTLVYRKKNEEGEQFKLKEVTWFQYRKSDTRIVYYKNSLDIEIDFKKISFLRKKSSRITMNLKKRYFSPVRISKEKKNDLMDLLPLIPPVFHAFYKNLATVDIPGNDPDLEDVSD